MFWGTFLGVCLGPLNYNIHPWAGPFCRWIGCSWKLTGLSRTLTLFGVKERTKGSHDISNQQPVNWNRRYPSTCHQTSLKVLIRALSMHLAYTQKQCLLLVVKSVKTPSLCRQCLSMWCSNHIPDDFFMAWCIILCRWSYTSV